MKNTAKIAGQSLKFLRWIKNKEISSAENAASNRCGIFFNSELKNHLISLKLSEAKAENRVQLK